MTGDMYVHLYCCGEPTALCGYNGPDEGPDAHEKPRCPTCLELEDRPCVETCGKERKDG